ncbi:MAG: hypothetical protein DYH13_02000 [Alphaproteobacteria bacterium PRO2]|nr:hypothetical protein [Alphaproteobacteria bacterium PRO2]
MSDIDFSRPLGVEMKLAAALEPTAAPPVQEEAVSAPAEEPVPSPLRYEPTPVPVGVFIFPVAKPKAEPA